MNNNSVTNKNFMRIFSGIALLPLLASLSLPAIAGDRLTPAIDLRDGSAVFLPILGSPSFAAAIVGVDRSAVVPSLQVNIATGGDDLRDGSVAYGEIQLRDGRVLPKVNLNGGQGWGGGSVNTVPFSLPAGITLGDLDGATMTISFDGAPRRFPDGYDNWNLESIRVATPRVCSGGRLLTSARRPAVRFTGAKTFERVPFRVPAADSASTPGAVNLTIATGGDDLREGSVAYAEIRLKDGRTLPKVNLNGGRTWGGGSTNSVSLPLAGKQLGDLESVTVYHDGGPRRPLDGYDNWNADVIKVTTPEACSSVTLGQGVGRPWERFTGSLTFKPLPLSVR